MAEKKEYDKVRQNVKIMPSSTKCCQCNNISIQMNINECRHSSGDKEHFLSGRELYIKGQLEEAIEKLKRSIEIDPEHSESHLLLGDIYERKNMYDEAVKEYSEVLRQKPDDRMTEYKLDILKRKISGKK